MNEHPNVVSLFSGAGGLDLGFKQAGFNLIWANDFDMDAVESYRRNIGDHIICGDLSQIPSGDIPSCDVLIGGFPCQGFSLANTKRSIEDSRNQLYLQYLRVLKDKKPLVFIAENVRGILSLGHGEVIKTIVSDFETVGYNVRYRLLNAADYGVPQTRRRVIIVGTRLDLPSTYKYPEPTHSKDGSQGLEPWVSIRTAIEHLPDPDGPESSTVANNVYSHYKVAPRNYTGHRPTDPNKPSPTILARGNGGGGVCAIPHYNGIRRLTVRESATVQTFPSDFYFYGKLNSCYRQVGNAVPVLFAKVIADSVLNYLRNE